MVEHALEPLITECPGCRTRFRVNESQLAMARGRVRCGACLSVFTATDNLVIGMVSPTQPSDATGALDELLEELRDDASRAKTASRELGRAQAEKQVEKKPAGSKAADGEAKGARPPEAAARPEVDRQPKPKIPGRVLRAIASAATLQPSATVQPPPATDTPPPVAETAADAGAAADRPVATSESTTTGDEEIILEAPKIVEDAPRERPMRKSRERPKPAPKPRLPAFDIDSQLDLAVPPPRKRRWWLLPATLLAAVALAAQVLWFQYDEWSRDLRYRPIYEVICPYAGCTLPVMRSLSSISSRNLVVRSHPEVPNALIVDALLVNEAPYAQPFPQVELRFSSMAGALVAGRRFQPSEYLAGELEGATMMTPNTPVHISLEIEDPGNDAVNYVVVFR